MAILGKTGMDVKRIGLGGIPIQRVTKQEAKELIQYALNSGVNFIDTAAGYTVSEEYIGNGIKDNPNEFYIATKSMSRDYENMKKDIAHSLEMLQRDYIDLYQLHNVPMDDYDRVLHEEEGAYRALTEAKAAGQIRHIGITSHNVKVLDKAIDDGYFETVQFPFNIVEDQGVEMFEKAKSKGIGTIIMKPLAGGALDNARLALKYILSKDFADIAIPGMASKDEINKNLSILNQDYLMTSSETEEIASIKSAMGDKFCRRCGYCMPCTQGINIPMQFLLEGYLTRYDLKDWAIERYDSMEKNAGTCTSCKNCESRCPYGLSISSMMKNVDKMFNNLRY